MLAKEPLVTLRSSTPSPRTYPSTGLAINQQRNPCYYLAVNLSAARGQRQGLSEPRSRSRLNETWVARGLVDKSYRTQSYVDRCLSPKIIFCSLQRQKLYQFWLVQNNNCYITSKEPTNFFSYLWSSFYWSKCWFVIFWSRGFVVGCVQLSRSDCSDRRRPSASCHFSITWSGVCNWARFGLNWSEWSDGNRSFGALRPLGTQFWVWLIAGHRFDLAWETIDNVVRFWRLTVKTSTVDVLTVRRQNHMTTSYTYAVIAKVTTEFSEENTRLLCESWSDI